GDEEAGERPDQPRTQLDQVVEQRRGRLLDFVVLLCGHDAAPPVFFFVAAGFAAAGFAAAGLAEAAGLAAAGFAGAGFAGADFARVVGLAATFLASGAALAAGAAFAATAGFAATAAGGTAAGAA